jgi:uncharacterized protein (TIGR01777 family)
VKRIVVSGGTGYIGRALVERLVGRGDSVTVLTRGLGREGNPRHVSWNPYELGEWGKVLDGVDAVVNLVGEQAIGVRYTDERKRRIRESRVIPTSHLARAFAGLANRPSVLVSASGINYYGPHSASERVDESYPAGTDFLARLCVDWEAACDSARSLGVRVVSPRISPVLGPGGGALKTMALPFKLFVGGKLGSGEQGFPWIHLDDAIAALLLCIDDETLPSKVNLCAPDAASNAQASGAIAKSLHRPNWLPVPGFALKALFGEGAEPILTGLYPVPRVLLEHGFRFAHPALLGALEASAR